MTSSGIHVNICTNCIPKVGGVRGSLECIVFSPGRSISFPTSTKNRYQGTSFIMQFTMINVVTDDVQQGACRFPYAPVKTNSHMIELLTGSPSTFQYGYMQPRSHAVSGLGTRLGYM